MKKAIITLVFFCVSVVNVLGAAYPDIIGTLKDNPGKDFYTVELALGAVQGRVLIPAGAWNVRINAYASQESRCGYAYRADGPPADDYSGVYKSSESAWAGAPWDHQMGRIDDAISADYQVKKADGSALIIADYASQTTPNPSPRWVYILPLVSSGSIHRVQIWFYVQRDGWKGWGWNQQNAPVKSYAAGPKFITAGGDNPPPVLDDPTPPDPPIPPLPFPERCKNCPPTPCPECPDVGAELGDDLTLTIKSVIFRGQTLSGPFVLEPDGGGWRLRK